MKIKIKTKDLKLTLPVPTFLINKKVVRYILKNITDSSSEFSEEQCRKIAKVLKKYVRKYKGLKLLEVEESNGDIVEITL